jgi:glycosyltransferase involved in cell wall biosynthesis
LKLLKIKNVPYRFSWITPDEPDECTGDVYVNPTQQKIAELLADADIYLCNSIYESFSLPVLEAMACGCSIITTPNDGVKEYCEDGNECQVINYAEAFIIISVITHEL